MKVCDLTVEIHYFRVKSFAKHCQIIKYGSADILSIIILHTEEKSMEDKMIALDFIQNQLFSAISLGVLITE